MKAIMSLPTGIKLHVTMVFFGPINTLHRVAAGRQSLVDFWLLIVSAC